MLIRQFTGSSKELFFCRYCGYPHETREKLNVRHGLHNQTVHYCSICNHKLWESDLYYVGFSGTDLNARRLKFLTSEGFRENMTSELKKMQDELEVDLLAWSSLEAEDTSTLRWRGVTNTSWDGFQEIKLRVGEGLAGKVVRYQRPFRVFYFDRLPEEYRQQYPIMQQESLLSAMAIPLILDEATAGCFLAGKRSTSRLSNLMLGNFESLTAQALQRVNRLFGN